MIQFNLLPDVKLAYIKAKRIEHMAATISGAVIIVSVVVLIAMFSIVDGFQKHSLGNTNKDIAKYETQIKSTPSLNKLLTVQNQLKSLPALDAQKPVVSRIFDYISQLTPQHVDLSSINLAFSADTISISGTADSVSTIDQFVDTLKFTTYNVSGSSNKLHAFSSVVMSSYGNTGQSSSFSVTANFDPVIFSEANNTPQLIVPNEVTTRSRSQQELPLFTGNNKPNNPTGH